MIGRTLWDSAYVLSSLPFAIASFVVIVTGLSLAAGLVIIWVGIPIGIATLYAAYGFASVERVRLRMRGTHIDWVKQPRREGSVWRRMLGVFADAGLWRAVLHGVVILPVVCVTWSVVLTWWAMAAGGLTGWIWESFGGVDSGAKALMALLRVPVAGWVFDLVVGILAVVTLPWVVRGCAAAQAALGKALLSPTRGSLERRITQLAHAREQLGQAESGALRRLERDLHDGPQQTLIRLGMDLAAAERRLAEGDVGAATTLVAGARQMVDSVIQALRALSRSIAPPILAERGLEAALLAAASTSAIPVTVRYTLSAEPSQAAATAAYYVACESLANAAKHSGASRVEIFVGADDEDRLLLEVSDDGHGGATILPGHGLAGLRDRICALDGRLSIGGTPGTRITAVLPM